MKVIYVFVALTAIFAVATIITNAKKMFTAKLIFKTTASLFFVLIGVASLNRATYQSWQALILAGLVFGLVGDIFLSVVSADPGDQKIFDAFGIVTFTAGHLFYILAFAELTSNFNLWLLILVAVCPLLIFALEATKVLKMSLTMKIGAVLYALVISTMLAFAVNVYLELGRTNLTVYILIGAVLFIISDLVIAFRNFSKYKDNQVLALTLGFYYVAQIMLALSIGVL